LSGMRYRTLGRSGLMVSVVGLGANNFGRRTILEETRAVVDAALDTGITFIDTADVYGNRGGSEEHLGKALEGRRGDVVIATKFGGDMQGAYGDDRGARGSRRYIRRAIEGSLRRLRTDHVDLYQYHMPDGITPVEETLAALDELITEGKILYAGSSNFDGWEVADAAWTARGRSLAPFISEQSEWSLLARGIEREVVPACERFGIGVIPYSPLADGLLSGKYRRGERPPEGTRLAEREDVPPGDVFDQLDALDKFAADRGISLLHLAIAWLAAHHSVGTVIAGARHPQQARQNAEAASIELSAQDLAALDEVVPSSRRE
jgi:aryl-alcohol dehydrogenase-like predicted oxidoreductase